LSSAKIERPTVASIRSKMLYMDRLKHFRKHFLFGHVGTSRFPNGLKRVPGQKANITGYDYSDYMIRRGMNIPNMLVNSCWSTHPRS
jgi:hypothetical protein